MKRSETAAAQFLRGYNCAQSVLFAFADRAGIPPDLALKLATGFGAGMGRRQEVCGAVSGAILALGFLRGRGEREDRSVQDTAYAMVRELTDRFSRKHGSFLCRDLLDGCPLLTPEGQERFRSENMKEKCAGFVSDAAALAEEIAGPE